MDVRARDDGPGRIVLTPVGELDLASADAFEAALDAALAGPQLRECVIDLAELEFLDSTGVRVLVHGTDLARERDVVLRVVDPVPVVERVLRVTSVGALLGLPERTAPPAGSGWRGIN